MSTRTTTEEGFELHGEITPIPELVRNLWRSIWMIRMLSRRNFLTRYRRTSFGVLWAMALPVVQAAVMSVVFTKVVRVKTELPYPVFALSGLIAWSFFSSTIMDAVRSIIGGGMAAKVYFPRAALPLISVASTLYMFVPNLIVLVIAQAVFRVSFGPQILFFAPATLLMVALTSSFSLVLAALQVYFRDVAFIVAAAIQPWLFASTVIFPIDKVHGLFRTLVLVNPATGMVEAFRVAILGFRPYSAAAMGSTCAWVAALLVFATLLFRRYDRVMIDLL